MAKTANLNIRIEPDVKSRAEELFSSFGITITDAVNLFLHQSLLEYRLPFQPHQPQYNAETLAAMQEALDIEAGLIQTKRYSSVEELHAELMAEMAEEDAALEKAA